jgi:hypothetical protein
MKLVILAVMLVFSGAASSQSCEEMSKRFFLKEMDGLFGEHAPPVKDRPKYVARLLAKIISEYPGVDATKCMTVGLEEAQVEKQMQAKRSDTEI